MKITKQKLESLILEEIKSLQEGMPADPNLPSLKGLEASLPGDRLGQKEEIELLNSIGVDPQKYMIDMSAVEGMIERGQINSYEDLIGNESELDEIILRRPQPGETEAPRRTHRHTSGLGTDPVTRNMRRRGLAENKMKLTKQQLKQIIKEEIEGLLDEIELDEKRKGKMPKNFSVKSGDKSKSGGLTAKGVKRYRRANPGSKLKTAVTKDPKKLKKGGKAAKRRLSFCRRMRGMKKKLTSKKTARDPDSRINKALRKWNC